LSFKDIYVLNFDYFEVRKKESLNATPGCADWILDGSASARAQEQKKRPAPPRSRSDALHAGGFWGEKLGFFKKREILTV
jgi:hypothetical protein